MIALFTIVGVVFFIALAAIFMFQYLQGKLEGPACFFLCMVCVATVVFLIGAKIRVENSVGKEEHLIYKEDLYKETNVRISDEKNRVKNIYKKTINDENGSTEIIYTIEVL